MPSVTSFVVDFSPGGSSLAVIERAIDAARSEALENAAHRGVKVRIVADWKAAQDRFSQTRILEDAGIPVRLDHHYTILHHKFMVNRRR